jgi:hypothetical protein
VGPRRRKRRHRLLLIVPYLWSVAAIPLVGYVRVSPGEIPFLLWWMLVGVLVTFASLAAVWWLDERGDAGEEDGR